MLLFEQILKDIKKTITNKSRDNSAGEYRSPFWLAWSNSGYFLISVYFIKNHSSLKFPSFRRNNIKLYKQGRHHAVSKVIVNSSIV